MMRTWGAHGRTPGVRQAYVRRKKKITITLINKPRGASPRRNYEDGISTNNLVLTIFYGVGNYIKKGGERSTGYGLIERF